MLFALGCSAPRMVASAKMVPIGDSMVGKSANVTSLGKVSTEYLWKVS